MPGSAKLQNLLNTFLKIVALIYGEHHVLTIHVDLLLLLETFLRGSDFNCGGVMNIYCSLL